MMMHHLVLLSLQFAVLPTVVEASCPVCTCASPKVWPFSGCSVECGARCDAGCCCILGFGKCPGELSQNHHNVSDALPSKMPNIGWLANGYNMYFGNPLSTDAGVDQGFTKRAGSAILVQTYNEGRTTGDGRYLLPDGFDVAGMNVGCTLSFDSSTTFKSSDYEDQLKLSVTAKVNYLTAAFQASTDYEQFYHRTTSSKQRVVSSVAKCTRYTATVNAYTRPMFTQNFADAVKELPADIGDGSAYFDFFDRFGTHAVMGATLGSRFGFTSYLSEDAWNTVQSTGVDAEVAASYVGIVSAGGTVKTGSQTKAKEAFQQSQQSFRLVTLGAKPVKGDAVAWMQQIVEEPMPIEYTLDSLCDVITDDSVKANCAKALQPEGYCEKRLVPRGDIRSCNGAKDPECVWSRDCSTPDMACENMHGVNKCVTFHGAYLTAHGTYLTAFGDGSVGQSGSQGSRQVFTNGVAPDRKVSLRAYNGKYISSRDDGSVGQAADWKGWESFTAELTNDGKTCLKTFQGRYISASDNGNVVQATQCLSWEAFTKVYVATYQDGTQTVVV